MPYLDTRVLDAYLLSEIGNTILTESGMVLLVPHTVYMQIAIMTFTMPTNVNVVLPITTEVTL